MSQCFEMNFAECSYGYGQVVSELGQSGSSASFDCLCMCCLEQTGPFVNLRSCSHTEFLINISSDCKITDMAVCQLCHRMLDKIGLFKQQVLDSLQNLTQQARFMASTRKINTLRRTRTETSYYGDDADMSSEVNLPIHLDTNDENLIKHEPAEIKYDCEDNIDNDITETDFIKAEFDSDENLEVLKEIVKKVKRHERKDNKKCKYKNESAKYVETPKNCDTNIKFRKIAPKIAPSEDKKPVTVMSKWEKQHMVVKEKKGKDVDESYHGKLELIRITPEMVLEERAQEMLKEEYVSKPFKCADCIKGFVVENELQVHDEKWHSVKGGTFQCELCKRTLKSYWTFHAHVNRHYNRYACLVCNVRFVTLNQAIPHYNTAHASSGNTIPMGHTCPQCGLTFPTPQTYRYHLSKHNETWQCHDCNKSFSSRSAIIAHIRAVHASKTNSFPCKECGKTFRTIGYLAVHSAVHRGKRPLSGAAPYCVQCDKVFSSSSALGHHMRNSSTHVKDDHKRFVCTECGSKFMDKRGLLQHIDFIHLHIERNTCTDCDKSFKTRGSLRRHQNDIHNHSPRKPKDQICHICGHGFETTRCLKIHMRRHTGERPLSCDICNATFAHPAALYTHRKLRHKLLPKRTSGGRLRTDCTAPQ